MKTTLLIITLLLATPIRLLLSGMILGCGWLACGYYAGLLCKSSLRNAERPLLGWVATLLAGPLALLVEVLIHGRATPKKTCGLVGLAITLLLCASAVVSAQTGTSTGGPVVFKASDFTKPQPVSTIKHSDFFRSFGPATIISTAWCGTGQSADIISSTGYEGNGFLRGADGRMNRAKAIPLKLGACALPLLAENHVSRKVRILLRGMQIGIGVLGTYDGAKNWKVNR